MYWVSKQKNKFSVGKQINDFINNITHEFKTPISTISLSAEVLLNPKIASEPERLKNYANIIKEENNRLKNTERSWFHIQNRMIIYTLCNILLIGGIYFFFGSFVTLAFIGAAIFGILQLETVNYIEHYGLLRKQNEHGRYERVKRTHSWNSDHVIGQAMLFNLSRHSDHHYNGAKHYQLLKTLPESPQMPTGYPGMMLLSLFPPLWFSVMHKKLQEI